MDISIILAAGEGTRMKSKKSKVLHTLLNKTMISYVLDASVEAGAVKNIIIAGKTDHFWKRVLKKIMFLLKHRKSAKEFRMEQVMQ